MYSIHINATIPKKFKNLGSLKSTIYDVQTIIKI